MSCLAKWLINRPAGRIISMSFLSVFALNSAAGSYEDRPPLQPEASEFPTAGDTDFRTACQKITSELAARGHFKLGNPLVTQTGNWGVVWRVDFEIAGSDTYSLSNRIVCWRPTNGKDVTFEMAIGQPLDPLHTPGRTRK